MRPEYEANRIRLPIRKGTRDMLKQMAAHDRVSMFKKLDALVTDQYIKFVRKVGKSIERGS